jgi:hypothetical protein
MRVPGGVHANIPTIYSQFVDSGDAAVTLGVEHPAMPEFRTNKSGSLFRFIDYIYDSLRNSRWVAVERDGTKRVETISLDKWTAMRKPQPVKRIDNGDH